ncbi:hypothetical protein TL16_g05665 [Triparma laevis f. inornata]|uniref:Threonylcarbamoyl-AMP synthase n=2 Tax=Triparma laevis TaxID=1534972 RepID=A0A9W7F9G1_9STRA|nr:hypothetical protein TL16_g05665 [Triparma laevis f. inornata]GMI06113.1 hypothetical protein TrLO_g2316 [Triparma laevis f. longispina]
MQLGTPPALNTHHSTATTPGTMSSTTPVTAAAALNMRAKLLPPTLAGVSEAAARLREGKLLAFPTETVYGLGANALMESSVMEIFKVKGRPLTDPLIIHVPSAAAALDCLSFPNPDPSAISEGRAMFDRLSEVFWPGALTIIALAKSHIPLKVSAGTGFVGLRCPSHPLAIRVLEAAGVPVAAPSANRFGHVSPTRASHVLNDLGNSDIAIMNGEDKREIFAVPACEFGIESTVVKINESGRELIVLRRGAITKGELEEAVKKKSGKTRAAKEETVFDAIRNWTVTIINTHDSMQQTETNINNNNNNDSSTSRKRRKFEPRPAHDPPSTSANGAGHVAPGQLLTHYAPDGMECYLVRPSNLASDSLDSVNSNQRLDTIGALQTGAVVIDFAGELAKRGLDEDHPSGLVLDYKDLSPRGDPKEAAKNLFAYLRWSEEYQGRVGRVLLADIATICPTTESDFVAGVADRMFRSASGKVIILEEVGAIND